MNGAQVTVTNGLVLNGTALVGNPTNGWYGAIGFAGSQTLGGSGTVVFGGIGNACNAVRLINGGHDADDWERDHGAGAEPGRLATAAAWAGRPTLW